MDKIYLTRAGYEKLVKELEYLKNVKRKEISAALEHARLLGDLRENSEYDAAKEALLQNEKRIQELEDKLGRAEIIDDVKKPKGIVSISSKVELLDLNTNENIEYTLVSQDEADPLGGFISIDSPVGKVLLGKKEGDIVEIKIPAGVLKYKIVKII